MVGLIEVASVHNHEVATELAVSQRKKSQVKGQRGHSPLLSLMVVVVEGLCADALCVMPNISRVFQRLVCTRVCALFWGFFFPVFLSDCFQKWLA